MEFVFVVPRTALFPERTPHGVELFESTEHGSVSGGSREAFDACVRDEGFFVERDYAERTPTLKQVIPYTVVFRRTAGSGTEVLLLKRTKGGGEVRLHDKLSIGVGGHVNPIDVADAPTGGGRDPLLAATRREVMEEELEVTGATRLEAIGLLNDDTNPVGAVHVGFVQVLELLDGDAHVREVEQLEGEFVTVDELRERLAAGANFETWSSMLVPLLDSVLTRPSERSETLVPRGAAAGGVGRSRTPVETTARS